MKKNEIYNIVDKIWMKIRNLDEFFDEIGAFGWMRNIFVVSLNMLVAHYKISADMKARKLNKVHCGIDKCCIFFKRLISQYCACAAELQSQHEQQLEEITERFELIKVSLSVSFSVDVNLCK